jgi:plasmid stabilization system protein ParE
VRAFGRIAAGGTIREELTSLPVRFWPVTPYPNYFIVYDPEAKPVQILRILHGARNVRSILE